MTDDSPGVDAAQAFDQLAQEVSVLHHTVEELVDAIQLKEQPDYSPTLGEITRDLGEIRARLDQMERHPALQLAPANYPAALERAGNLLMREAATKLDQAMRETERTTQALAALVGAVRTQGQQNRWLKITAGTALTLGLILAPFLARLLPFGLDGRIAAAIMAADRWNAGAALMAAQSPEGWRELARDAELMKLNAAAIGACRAAAVKAKQEQRCVIVVAVPAT
jgi:hypothetical protein